MNCSCTPCRKRALMPISCHENGFLLCFQMLCATLYDRNLRSNTHCRQCVYFFLIVSLTTQRSASRIPSKSLRNIEENLKSETLLRMCCAGCIRYATNCRLGVCIAAPLRYGCSAFARCGMRQRQAFWQRLDLLEAGRSLSQIHGHLWREQTIRCICQ